MAVGLVSSRRTLIAGGASLLATAALPRLGRAESLAAVSLGMGWIPNVEYAGFWVALENGYFAEEGIDVGYTPGGPNAPGALVRLAAGQADYAGADWLPTFEAINRDNDLVVVASGFPISPAALMSMSNNPVLTPEDLVGKRILAQMPTDRHTVDFILSKAGLPLDYELVMTGFSPEPLLAGDGDCYFAFATNQPATFEGMGLVNGEDFEVVLMKDLGYDVPAGPIVALRSYVEENRALVVGFLRALVRGWIKNGEDPAFAAQLVTTKYGADFGLDLAQQTRQNELGQPLIMAQGAPGPLWFDASLVETNIKPVAEAAGFENIPSSSDIVDLGPLEEALTSL